MSVEWIEHKGKKILLTTYTGLSWEKMIEAIKEQAEIVKQSPDKIIMLDDFRDTYATKEFMDIVKDLRKNVIGPKTEKQAILGVVEIKKVLLQAYNLFTKHTAIPFETKEEALDFLVKE